MSRKQNKASPAIIQSYASFSLSLNEVKLVSTTKQLMAYKQVELETMCIAREGFAYYLWTFNASNVS